MSVLKQSLLSVSEIVAGENFFNRQSQKTITKNFRPASKISLLKGFRNEPEDIQIQFWSKYTAWTYWTFPAAPSGGSCRGVQI